MDLNSEFLEGEIKMAKKYLPKMLIIPSNLGNANQNGYDKKLILVRVILCKDNFNYKCFTCVYTWFFG